MTKFKISIRHKGCSQQEIREVEARSLIQARKICEEIKKENLELVEKCNNCNVYTSRVIEECSVVTSNWHDEFLGCMDFDKDLLSPKETTKDQDLKNNI